MWKSPIGFGNCSFAYLYIFGSYITRLIEDYLISLEDIKSTLKYNIFHITTVLKSHKLIRVLYRYISFIIFGLLFFHISNNKKKSEKEKENEVEKNPHNKLIFQKHSTTKRSLVELLIVSAFFTLIKILRKVISYYKVSDLDFWIVNIVFVTLYMNKYFGHNIHKHQQYSLYFIFLSNVCLLFIAAAIPKNKEKETIFKKLGWYSILILFAYIILSWISSLTKVYSKKLMDFNYISPYRIIVFMGLFGTIFSLITLAFTSGLSCGKSTTSYCKVKKVSNNITKTYLDSISIYFTELGDVLKKRKYKEFYFEIFIVTPLYILFNFIEFAFTMLIILYLNPNYILISDCIYFSTTKLLEFTINGNYSPKKFAIEYTAELLALVGYAIYLEIIVLRFCGLDLNIKKNIMKRSTRESLTSVIDSENGQIVEKNYDEDTLDINLSSLSGIELGDISAS